MAEDTESHKAQMENALRLELNLSRDRRETLMRAIDNYIVGRVAELTGQPIPDSEEIYSSDFL